MSDTLLAREDGTVWRFVMNAEPDDQDPGFYDEVTAAELLQAARRFLNDDLILAALEGQAVNKAYRERIDA